MLAESCVRANKLPAQLRWLRELERRAFGGTVDLHSEPKFLDQNGLESVRKIRIAGCDLQADDFARCLLLRNLDEMVIKEMDTRALCSKEALCCRFHYIQATERTEVHA